MIGPRIRAIGLSAVVLLSVAARAGAKVLDQPTDLDLSGLKA